MDRSDDNSKWKQTSWQLAAILVVGLMVIAGGLWGVGVPKEGIDGAATSADASGMERGRPAEAGQPDVGSIEDPLARASEFYDSRPYYQQPLPHTEVPEGLSDMRAETCGGCHQEIYQEWKVSTHRRAWTQDPQFMAELKKSRQGGHAGGKQDDVGWMCVTCHTPLVNQMERLVVGLRDGDIGKPVYVDNPSYDAELQQDAITCAACHVSNGKVYGPYGDTDAPHPTAKDPQLRSSEQCTQCHQANAEWPSRNLACFFDTGEQWAASSYAEGDDPQTCQSCHMPEVERKLAKAYDRPKRKTRRHWFGGSLIPKQPKFHEEMEALRSVYGSGATLKVQPRSALETLRTTADGRLTTSRCESDSCDTWVIRATNSRAGHWLPTGDPERHIDIRAVVRSTEGEVVTEAEQRIASRYEWWPKIKKLYDNRLEPHESLDVPIRVASSAERPLYIDVVAKKYRMYTEAFEHHELEGEYVRGRTFHRSSWRVDKSGKLERLFVETDLLDEGNAPNDAIHKSGDDRESVSSPTEDE